MKFNTAENADLEHLARIREILAPAIRWGVEVTTTTGEVVTFSSLPALVEAGESIEMIGKNGELIAVTYVEDMNSSLPRRRLPLPTFCQETPEGIRTNFHIEAEISHLPEGHRPAPLRLREPLLNIQRDEHGTLHRVSPERLEEIRTTILEGNRKTHGRRVDSYRTRT